jgi:hypothetical protein
MAKWKRFLHAALGAVVLQLLLTPLLGVSVAGIPALVPEPGVRALPAAFAFVAGLIAGHRPVPPEKACSIFRCAVRGFLWALLSAGFLFEFGSLMRFSLLPVPLSETLRMSQVVFGVVWVIAFTVLASDALDLRRTLRSARI